MSHGSLAVALALAPALAAPSAPKAPPAEIETTLWLIGDAGAPARRGEPVLTALKREAGADPQRSVIAFLGDNAYPIGLQAPRARGRAESERRLDAQIDAARASGARVIFVPGNHDWARERPDGWEAVKRQAERVRSRGGPAASFLPSGGCPGPDVVDLGQRLRLLILDTQWWLHAGPKPTHPTSSCGADSPDEVLASLRAGLEGAGERHVVVLAHHPLATGGPHGGRFSIRDHLFPLTRSTPWLWLPLPGIGSLYPAARRAGFTNQDLNGPANVRMRARIESVLSARPPLVWGSGHDHNLQVIDGRSARHLLVSGAGVFGHQDPAARIRGSRLALDAAGFMRLDFLRDGRVRLGVLVVDRAGRGAERYSEWLD